MLENIWYVGNFYISLDDMICTYNEHYNNITCKWLFNDQEKLPILYDNITMTITIQCGDITMSNNAVGQRKGLKWYDHVRQWHCYGQPTF